MSYTIYDNEIWYRILEKYPDVKDLLVILVLKIIQMKQEISEQNLDVNLGLENYQKQSENLHDV